MKYYDTLFHNTKNTISIRIELATLIGYNEATVLSRLDFYLNGLRLYKDEVADWHFIEGKWWYFNTFENWQKCDFPFWSVSTIKRVFKSLTDSGIVIQRKNLNNSVMDHKSCFTIDYDRLDSMYESGLKDSEKLREYVGDVDEKTSEKTSDSPIVSNWHNRKCQNDTMIYNNIYNINNNNNYTDSNNTKEKKKGYSGENTSHPSQIADVVTDVLKEMPHIPELDKGNIICFISDYELYYRRKTGKRLSCTPEQARKIAEGAYADFAEDVRLSRLTADEMDWLIDKHFGTKYQKGCDYGIFHFLQPNILRNRYYEYKRETGN